jgi:hypothetical protein
MYLNPYFIIIIDFSKGYHPVPYPMIDPSCAGANSRMMI